MKRIALAAAALALMLVIGVAVIHAANVLTDSAMENAGITSWPLTNVTGTNTSTKATDQKDGATGQSLKGTSQSGNKINVEWYNSQSGGTINAGDTVLLSLWYGVQFNNSVAGGASGTLYADLVRSGGTATRVWSQSIAPSTTFQSNRITSLDVSSSVTTSGTYTLRIGFTGKTGGATNASINTWFDSVTLDVTSSLTTVGDGSDSAGGTTCSAAREIDAFTLQTNTGGDALTSVTVAVTNPTALSLLEITNDAGSQVYGSVSNPASTSVTIPVASLSATTTLTQYKVRATPKAQSALTGTTSYDVTANVTAIASSAPKSYADADGTTITIDNTPTANATWAANSAADGQVVLNWTNPNTADFAHVVILRSTSSPITAVPVEGATYTAGDTIGATQVRYAGTATTTTDTAVVNGTTYYYKLFARDGCGNYSAGVESNALRPQAVPQTTTVGDGTNPPPSNSCPGGAAQEADAFTLQTTGGSDAVTSITVTLTGAPAALSAVQVASDDGATAYGTITNPASNVIAIPVTLTATTAFTQYKVRVTPKSDAAMPAGTQTIAATVTAIASSNQKSYEDAAGSTVTIDNAAPSEASWIATTASNAQIALSWSYPGDASSVVLLRDTNPIAAKLTDGTTYVAGASIGSATIMYAGTLASFTDTNVINGTTYYYELIARDGCGNYSAGLASPALTPSNVVPRVTAQTGSATVDSCNQLTLRAPFSGDVPASNSTTTFERATAIGGPWTPVCSNVTGASPRVCAMASLSPGTTYYVRITFADADGVTGQNPQLVGPLTTPNVCTAAATTVAAATAQVSSCKQITVTMPFTGDGDRDGATKVEFNTTNSWPATVACAAAKGPSPRQCLVTQLSASTAYYLRITTSDPDGVSGSATQILGPLTTTVCGTDTAAPMLLFLAPARGAILGGTTRAKVQVWDSGGLAATNPLSFSIDNGAASFAVAQNTSYACGLNCRVYEFDLVSSALANGEHFVTVQATDAANNVARVAQPFAVNNGPGGTPRGGGTLLRRTHSSQLCIDCHAVGSHTSQTASSTKYGNWANDCLSCHTPHLTPNIKLIRPAIETPNSGTMSVDFRALDESGGTNPQYGQLGAFDASGAPFNDGICESCHTKTTHYRNDASGGDHTHYQGQRCTGCHTHGRGFKATSCIDCHYAPPTIGKHRLHDQVWDSTSGNSPASYADSASHATSTQYGYACVKCHGGTHENDKNNPAHDGTQTKPWQAEVVLGSGSYSATYAANAEQGPSGDYFSWSNGSCTNNYCHSNAAPLNGTNSFASPAWNQSTAIECDGCHKTGGFGDGANDSTFLSKSHARHIQSTSGESNTYSYRCDECHSAVIRDTPNAPWALTTADLADKRLHVNEEKQDVRFSTTLLATAVDQSAGSYDRTVRNCTNTYCHSPGTKTSNFDAPNFVLVWGASTAGCASCHGGNAASASPIITGRHTQHVAIAATYGVNLTCDACHNATVSNDSTVSNYANHVNGTPNVAGTYAGTWAKPNCTSSRCHSSGQRLATPEYYGVSWSGTAIGCNGCHGRHSDNAFPSVAGEPNYATNASLSKYNSHKAHVSSANDCHDCHAATVSTSLKIDGTSPTRHLDFDGTPDVVYGVNYAGGTYNASTRQCTVSCHGSGTPVWGGAALVCGDCHLAAADNDNWNITDRVVSTINQTEWTTTGHGTSAIALPGTNACLYCHTTSAGHKDATNPFRLANYNATGDGANSVCLICHKTGSAGYNPGSGAKNGTKKIDSYHYATKHGASNNGGRRCWDCHDPHGDGNIKMIGKTLIKTSADEWGLSTTRTGTTIFTANSSAANYVTQGTGITATGVCNVCHTTAGHYTSTSGDSHGTSGVCTSCHPHDQAAATDAFKNIGGGGNCLGCHGDGSGAPARRPVNNDFTKNSHHVGNGSTMGGTLTNFDCVVCHAEGKIVAGATDTTGQPHMDGKIDLRNADSATAYFTYDKGAVSTAAGAAANWNSGNATWRTQMSTALDPFCLSCHDANGASQIAVLGETGATATNPFKDTTVTNNYDQVNRTGVVDIKSKVSGAPPAQGTFSRHAIRGQSISRYTKFTGLGGTYQSMYQFGTFNATMPDENGNTWNDTSVMGCADCHTVDGANGTTANAHGSTSEYLLKDAAGGAAEGSLTGQNYVCYRCHALAKYDTGRTHAPNGGDYQDTTAQTGALRVTTGKGASVFGMACMNCHGGAGGFGWIHGTNQTFGTGSGGTGTARNAYRFTNGASLRYYQPATNWEGPGSCFTLGTADSWGGCTQHSRSSGSGITVPLRPVNY